MIKNYYVFDDIIPNEEQMILNNYVKNNDIEWESLENIIHRCEERVEEQKFPARVHPKPNCKNEEINRIIDGIELAVTKKLNLEFVKNYRWKINWTTPIGEYNQLELLHYDTYTDHIAMVYYINDSTGDTHIYNNVNGDNVEVGHKNYYSPDYKSYTLLTTVSPKMGRCVVFDGKLAHHGNYPINGDRFIVNFNFVAKQKNTKNSLI
jgi:hypothetical protein